MIRHAQTCSLSLFLVFEVILEFAVVSQVVQLAAFFAGRPRLGGGAACFPLP